jgi:pimeloyl-ACP methyl ester carboxylesterase
LVVTDVDDGDRFLAFVTHNPPRLPARIKTAFHADAIKHRQQLDDIFWIIAREMRDGPLNDRLGDVRAPTLIIWGRHDRVIDVSCVPVMESAIAGSKAVILEDIGHVPMVEAPKPTADAIKQFLRSL